MVQISRIISVVTPSNFDENTEKEINKIVLPLNPSCIKFLNAKFLDLDAGVLLRLRFSRLKFERQSSDRAIPLLQDLDEVSTFGWSPRQSH